MPDSLKKLTIRAGTYFGERFTDNSEEIAIEQGELSYSLKSRFEDDNHPNIKERIDLGAGELDELADTLDIDTVEKMPEKIGLPDAADQGSEWIEISDGKNTKRIEFEFGADVPEISDLLEVIRSMRRKASEAHGRKSK